MASKLVLQQKDYDDIEHKLQSLGFLKDSQQDFAVTTQRIKAKYFRTTHVFARPPMKSELKEYEQIASKLKIRGPKAELEGSRLTAAETLYNKIIHAVFDIPVGRQVLGSFERGQPLTREEAIEKVPLLVKRAAIIDMVGEVYSASQMEEREGERAGEDDEDESKKEED